MPTIDPRPDDTLWQLTRLLREQDEEWITRRHDLWHALDRALKSGDGTAPGLRAEHERLLRAAVAGLVHLNEFERRTLEPRRREWEQPPA